LSLTLNAKTAREGAHATPLTIRPAYNFYMTESIATRIEREVASWPDVTVEPHRFGGREFRLGRRELGHLHGDRQPICRFRITSCLGAAG
jgi:hypothetical protein